VPADRQPDGKPQPETRRTERCPNCSELEKRLEEAAVIADEYCDDLRLFPVDDPDSPEARNAGQRIRALASEQVKPGRSGEEAS